MYEGDSFFTLTASGQIALAVLSGLLVFLMIGAVRLTRRQVTAKVAAPAIGLLFWWLFVWLSPQLYYLLYMVLLEDLPWQLVVDWPPGPGRLVELLTFRGRTTIADHAIGTFGWALILAGLPRA